MKRAPLFLLVSLLALFASACTGPTGGQDQTQRDPEPEDETVISPRDVNLAEYEDFDAAPYREETPEAEVDLDHDVPSQLMAGDADAGITREVDGFRIQIYSTEDRARAEEELNRAISWWNSARDQASGDYFGDELPVYIRYRQPYYRVRVGNFVSRAQANEALATVRSRYPDAFISPDTVVIER